MGYLARILSKKIGILEPRALWQNVITMVRFKSMILSSRKCRSQTRQDINLCKCRYACTSLLQLITSCLSWFTYWWWHHNQLCGTVDDLIIACATLVMTSQLILQHIMWFSSCVHSNIQDRLCYKFTWISLYVAPHQRCWMHILCNSLYYNFVYIYIFRNRSNRWK